MNSTEIEQSNRAAWCDRCGHDAIYRIVRRGSVYVIETYVCSKCVGRELSTEDTSANQIVRA